MTKRYFFLISLFAIALFLNQCDGENDKDERLYTDQSGDLNLTLRQITYGQKYDVAAAYANDLGYRLIRYRDTQSGRTFYLLKEEAALGSGDFIGGGTYIFYPDGKNVVLEIPHPVFDTHTAQQGIDLFFDSNASFLMLAGTHRNSNSETQKCQSQYHDGDVAHTACTFFQSAHKALSDQTAPLLFLQLHGFGSDSLSTLQSQCSETNATALVAISEGVSHDGNLSRESFANHLYNALDQEGTIQPCLYSPALDQNASDPYVSILGGTTNVQGRYTNYQGENPNPCITGANTNTHRFIHLEQSQEVRGAKQSLMNRVLTGLF